MRFAFIAHSITKHDNLETISLSLHRTVDPEEKITLSWERTSGGDWTNPKVEEIALASAAKTARTLSSIGRFIKKLEIDPSDPDALITAIQRHFGELLVKDASGKLVKYSDVIKGSDQDEYLTQGAGMKKRYSVRSDDEDRARGQMMRMMTEQADQDPEVYDDISAWGKGGKKLIKVEKKGAIKEPDLAAYCKRGHARSAGVLKIKREGAKPAAPKVEAKPAAK